MLYLIPSLSLTSLVANILCFAAWVLSGHYELGLQIIGWSFVICLVSGALAHALDPNRA